MARPARNLDLHGSVPDTSTVALLLIDVITDFSFEGGDRVLGPAAKLAGGLSRLKRRCRRAGIPAIYVNDNAGRWRDDQRSIVARALDPRSAGRRVVEPLAPVADDYFVVKPKHSAFFATPLQRLLTYLDARVLILTGIGTNLCVYFTAVDAHMRDYRLVVPSDCAIAIEPADHRQALRQMRRFFDADTRASTRLNLRRLAMRVRGRRTRGRR